MKGILVCVGRTILEKCNTRAQDRLLETEASNCLMLDGPVHYHKDSV